MAHIQYNGTRISGKKRSIVSGQSMNLELWGPYTPTGQYIVISSDPTAVEVTPGAVVPGKNLQLYKLTAKSFSLHVKIEIVAGELTDSSRGYSRNNLKGSGISCDYIYVSVQPDSTKIIFAEYFNEVIPAIASGLAEYNAANKPVLVDKAGFLLVQTYCEQSPGVTGAPSKHGNRMFNVQALVTRAGDKITGTVPGQEEPGVTISSLSQGEGPTDATRKPLSSPTFYYESPVRAVIHYIKVLKARYTSAYRVITDPSGSFSQFADALQAGHFATDANYGGGLKDRANQVLGQAKKWLDYGLMAIDHEVAVSGSTMESDALKADRERLVDFQKQLSRFRS
jgi:hypothetical protein